MAETWEELRVKNRQLALISFMHLARGLVVRVAPDAVRLFADPDSLDALCTIPESHGTVGPTIDFDGVLVDRHLAFVTLSKHWIWYESIPWIISPQNGGSLTVTNVALSDEEQRKSVWPIGWPVVYEGQYYTPSSRRVSSDSARAPTNFENYLRAYLGQEQDRTKRSPEQILAGWLSAAPTTPPR